MGDEAIAWIALAAATVSTRIATGSTPGAAAVFFGLYFLAKVTQ